MGKSITPTHIVKYTDQQGDHKVVWHSKSYGPPDRCRLSMWVAAMDKSMEPGGSNEQVSQMLGYVPVISKAEIFNQKLGKTMVTITMNDPV